VLSATGTVSAPELRERWGIPVPDQSQSYSKTSPPTQQSDETVNNPASMTGNDPAEATQESQESNTTRASEGEHEQARQAIEGDPTVESGGDNYDDESAWSYRALQQEAKGRGLRGGGERDELIARLRSADSGSSNDDNTAGLGSSEPAAATDTPRGDVDPAAVDNGGIQQTGFGRQHAELLQGLSDERRSQQLAASRERSAQDDGSADDTGTSDTDEA
jgi:hypothetical protein